MADGTSRITSYNVCYTKLLRLVARVDRDTGARVRGALVDPQAFVITSYSIHYTKLYERRQQQAVLTEHSEAGQSRGVAMGEVTHVVLEVIGRRCRHLQSALTAALQMLRHAECDAVELQVCGLIGEHEFNIGSPKQLGEA